MAIQSGLFQFTGKLGELVGRKVKGKHIVQEPGGFTAAKHKKKTRKDKRVRENYAEFRNASAIRNPQSPIPNRTTKE